LPDAGNSQAAPVMASDEDGTQAPHDAVTDEEPGTPARADEPGPPEMAADEPDTPDPADEPEKPEETVPVRAGPDFGPRPLEDTTRDFPCETSGPTEIGLALSGGGLRATLFHLGSLMRLRELGWLARIDRVSCVSGGSIMAAILARAWARLAADGFSEAAFEELVTRPTLRFAGRHLDVFVIAAGLVPGVNPADILARWFDRDLTGGMRLAELPRRPRFVFNAAHLASGMAWRFSRPYMGDARLGVVCEPALPLARAVAASAAFPPFVAPLVLDLSGMTLRHTRGADLHDDPRFRQLHERVLLLDGGAYDNLGIETVEGRCRVVLASDAGGDLKVDAGRSRYRFWWPLVRRTLDMAVEVGRAQRRRALIDRATAGRELPPGHPLRRELGTEHVALWRTSLEIAGHRLLPEGWTVQPGWNDYLASRPTRLWPMPLLDRRRLVNWGYLTSDLMLRTWVPELTDAPPPARLPFPGAAFASRPPG
jgi:NTE family protein